MNVNIDSALTFRGVPYLNDEVGLETREERDFRTPYMITGSTVRFPFPFFSSFLIFSALVAS